MKKRRFLTITAFGLLILLGYLAISDRLPVSLVFGLAGIIIAVDLFFHAHLRKVEKPKTDSWHYSEFLIASTAFLFFGISNFMDYYGKYTLAEFLEYIFYVGIVLSILMPIKRTQKAKR